MKALFVLALIAAAAFSGESVQTDWSEGPGVPGPVTYWGSSFESHIQTAWKDFSGSLMLSFHPVAHTVTTYMGCIHTGYAADMDGDGDMDILGDSGYRKLIAWFENDGSGGSWTRHDVAGPFQYSSPWSAVPADIDNDGYMDVVSTQHSAVANRIDWWRNVGGTGIEWTQYTVDDDFLGAMFACCADMDGDIDLDVIACSYGPDGQIAWWENELPQTTWTKHTISTSSEDGVELFVVDLDKDDDMDVLSANNDNMTISFWRNDGGGVWSRQVIHDDTNGGGSSVYATDIDLDSDLDIVATVATPISGMISWFENVDGSCTVWEQHVIDGSFQGATGVHAADLTEDGFVDVLGCAGQSWGLQELVLWESVDGTGESWIRHELDEGPWYDDIDVADIDGDDTLDVVGCAAVGTSIKWFRLGYKPFGNLTSSVLDLVGYPEWDQIAWTSDEPSCTDIRFQVKSSNDPDDMGLWSSYIESPGSLAGYIDSTHRFIQYKVWMETTERFVTPVLEQVAFLWDNMGMEGESTVAFRLFPVEPNPSAGCVTVRFALSEPSQVEIRVFDMSGRLMFFAGDPCSAGIHTALVADLIPGVYFVKLKAGDHSAEQRFVVVR